MVLLRWATGAQSYWGLFEELCKLPLTCFRPYPCNFCKNWETVLSLLLLRTFVFDFLVRVGPKQDPILFHPYLGLPPGGDRLSQREFCSLLFPTSEKHSASLTETFRAPLSKLVFTMAKVHVALSFPALPSSPIHPFHLRLCLVVLVPHFPIGPEDMFSFSELPPVHFPEHWFCMTLQLRKLPAHSLSPCGEDKTGRETVAVRWVKTHKLL